MIFEQIRKDALKALKDGNKRKNAFLGYVIGQLSKDVTMVNGAKIVEDDKVVKKIKTLISQNAEAAASFKDAEAKDNAASEKEWLEGYLPEMLTEAEITDIISKNATSMPEAMAYLKANYPGRYDGGSASKIAKAMF